MRGAIRKSIERGERAVAVAGGDGTVGCAVQELARSDVALAILPLGTRNNFANALRLPQDLPNALRVLRDGVERLVDLGRVDLGRVDGRYFTEAAGVGLFADLLATYGRAARRSPVRTLVSILKVSLNMRPARLHLTLDGRTLDERAVFCTIANTFRMAQGLPIAPGARLTDGVFDVVIFGDLHRREILTYYMALRRQAHESLPKVQRLTAREVRIQARPRLRVHCDDRIVGKTPATAVCESKALKVWVERA
jgi:diacylglycerol kinase (ATP)